MLATLGVSFVTVCLAVVWIASAEVTIPGIAVSGADYPVVFWMCLSFFALVGIAGATIAAGGAICLAREWKQLQ